MSDKVGLGVLTCNREMYLNVLLDSLASSQSHIGEFVVVNDGAPLSKNFSNINVLQNEVNLGVGKSKNRIMQYLLDAGCDHIFVVEDDMVIKRGDVIPAYIETAKVSGIQHLNYGPGSPFNRKQTIRNYDLHNRHLLDQHSEPKPRMVIEYNTAKVALYEHTVAMFSYFSRNVLETVGLIDTEHFRSAFDHVEHTYRIIKAGFHPPFWHFADIDRSWEYMEEAPDAIANSAVAKNETKWMEEVMHAREVYKQLHGHYPNQPPQVSEEDAVKSLLEIKMLYGQ